MFDLYTSELASLASTSQAIGLKEFMEVWSYVILHSSESSELSIAKCALEHCGVSHGSLCTMLSVGHALLMHSYGPLISQWLETCRLHFSVASWNTPMMDICPLFRRQSPPYWFCSHGDSIVLQGKARGSCDHPWGHLAKPRDSETQ